MVKTKILGIITVLLFVCKYIECDDIQETPSSCVDFRPQNNLDTDQLLGIWYGNEIITHRNNENNELDQNSCVEIILDDITRSVHMQYNYDERPKYRYLKLIWNDGNNDYEHILLYNQTNRGVWIAKTTPVTENLYTHNGHAQLKAGDKQNFGQFTGVIQVLKFVGNHVVLNFCENDGRLFSIALARSPNMYTPEDLASVHTLFQRRGLSAYSAHRLCKGSAVTHNMSIITLFIAFFACIFKHF
ncbi:uncharacterized protein LOC129571597 [Sitodiplosis mosellana]|uniref:uncharacterized protein LOC129571597 n=1 Tax=Sitodiplosis mosellana TaxID=263140 RepID=UPI002445065D|nr:uncharacterized protein LOC129571597 [Sitodiplosis mosellana]